MESKSRNALPKKKTVPRFIFDMQRDIELLKAALTANPWQFGKEKWVQVVKYLKERYNYDIKPRTAKERIDLLIQKLQKEELNCKSTCATEEEKTEREQLLQSIIIRQEHECIDIPPAELGSNYDTNPIIKSEEMPFIISSVASLEQEAQRADGDDEREPLESSSSADSNMSSVNYMPSASNSESRNKYAQSAFAPRVCMKRRRLTREESMLNTKLKHDMDMEKLQLKLKEDWKEKELQLESTRLEIELMREQRLTEEGRRRDAAEELRQKRVAEDIQRHDEFLFKLVEMFKEYAHNKNS